MEKKLNRTVPFKSQTVVEVLRWVAEYLSSCKVLDPFIEAEHLLIHILGCPKKDLLIHPERVLSADEMERFKAYVFRRGKREPLQYIIGEVEFRGLLFKVSKDVLIPRPETELLVEVAIQSVDRSNITVLDLCTGSGCIAICIAKELNEAVSINPPLPVAMLRSNGSPAPLLKGDLFPPLLKGGYGGIRAKGCRVYAVDISAGAIEVAKENAGKHGVEDRVTFHVGDLFRAIEPFGLNGKIDLIVSNPPYVSRKEMEALQPEIKEYEPASALYGGEDGLDFYRRIIHEAPAYLAHGGLLIMEMGYGQAERVKGLFGEKRDFTTLEVKKDLAGIERVIKAIYTG